MKKILVLLIALNSVALGRSDLPLTLTIAEQKLQDSSSVGMTEDLVTSIAQKFKKDPVIIALAINSPHTRSWLDRFFDQEKKRLGLTAYKNYLADVLESVIGDEALEARKTAAVAYLLTQGAAFRQSQSIDLNGKGILSGPYWITQKTAGAQKQPIASLRTMYQQLSAPLAWQSFAPVIARRMINGQIVGGLLLTNNQQILSELVLYTLNPDTLSVTEIGRFYVPQFKNPIQSLLIYPLNGKDDQFVAIIKTDKIGSAQSELNLLQYTKGKKNPRVIGTIPLKQSNNSILNH